MYREKLCPLEMKELSFFFSSNAWGSSTYVSIRSGMKVNACLHLM